MVILSTEWLGQGTGSFPLLTAHNFSSPRKKFEATKLSKATNSETNTKKANLSVKRREKIRLPRYSGEGRTYHIREFLNHPLGIEAMLNKNALKSFQLLDANTYRCTLPKLQLLNFEAAPTLDLQVIPTDEDFTVEMLSCKFEGSELVERQNEHFSDLYTSLHPNAYRRSRESREFVILMKKYEAERKPANIAMMAILDGFQKAYSVDFGPLNILRAAAFHGANYISPLKKSIISYASGDQRLPLFT